MSNILEFKGKWRTYQERVLKRADDYLKDGRIHIVAAPGSGKTTLGIELIQRIGRPALVLAPSITIREQWLSRIKEAFLKDGIRPEDYLSNSLKKPAFITVATYQALHSAMTKTMESETSDGDATDEETDDLTSSPEKEIIDYSQFELVEVMKKNGLGVLCLDECHHLRSEWWKALENFRKIFDQVKVISLTATPPYDSTPEMWKRYIAMCGDIDEEITIPELVKEGSLCPHQDYVYFNYPTKEETEEIEKFRENSNQMLQKLMCSPELEAVIQNYNALIAGQSEDELLENPSFLSALLIYLQAKKIEFPKRLVKLLGAKRLPSMEEKWMEILLQGILYGNKDSVVCDQVFKEQLISELKSEGLIEKKKVCMATNTAVEKLLIRSKGKINSIKDITFHEYRGMGGNLRLLILTDYIRKECEKNLGNPEADMNQLGVLPFFEILRREAEEQTVNGQRVRLGVLCGTMVIIPADAKTRLVELVGEDRVMFSKAGMISENEYLVVKGIGDDHILTAAITTLFSEGYMQALIGTKSLLGEGWDAPCVNSLILASFVGSFMLSNQMRGRAIRIDKTNPDKTSNIWHLVCVNSKSLLRQQYQEENQPVSQDFRLLERRMEHFMGLNYEEDVIENGMTRLTPIKPTYKFTQREVGKINEEMLETSSKRVLLRERWKRSLEILNRMEVVDEVDISENRIIYTIFFDHMKKTIMIMISSILCATVSRNIRVINSLYGTVIAIVIMVIALEFLRRTIMLRSPLRRLKVFGKGIQKAMIQTGLLANDNNKVETMAIQGLIYAIYLKGATNQEEKLFSDCVSQFFSEIDSQRYLLYNHRKRNGLNGFFAVPDSFARKKEDAEVFAECMRQFIGKYELIYTRNEQGRKILLEGRLKALGSREERYANRRKKVKSALE